TSNCTVTSATGSPSASVTVAVRVTSSPAVGEVFEATSSIASTAGGGETTVQVVSTLSLRSAPATVAVTVSVLATQPVYVNVPSPPSFAVPSPYTSRFRSTSNCTVTSATGSPSASVTVAVRVTSSPAVGEVFEATSSIASTAGGGVGVLTIVTDVSTV